MHVLWWLLRGKGRRHLILLNRLLLGRLHLGLGSDKPNPLLSRCLRGLFRGKGCLSLLHSTSHIAIGPAT